MSKTTNINIRISPELKAKLQALADKDNRSLSNYIESVLIKIAEKKYHVGTKVKCLHDCQDLIIDTDFTAYLEFDGEALRYTKEGFGVTAIWCKHETNKWAEPITEQKELYYITIVGNSIHITTRFGLDLERAALAIRETLKNL